MSQAFARVPGLSGAAPPAGVHWKNTAGSQPVAGLLISWASLYIYTFRHDDDDGNNNNSVFFCRQDVVRSWYSRLPDLVQNAHNLVSNSEDCTKAVLEGETFKIKVHSNKYIYEYPAVR